MDKLKLSLQDADLIERFKEEFEYEYCKEHPENNKTCVECALNRLQNELVGKFEDFLRTNLKPQLQEIGEKELRKMFVDNNLITTRECNACDGNGCPYCDGVGLVDNEYGYFVKDIIAKFGKPSGGGVE